MDYLNQVTALTEKVLQAIGVSLGYDESYFDEICTEPMAFYQLLHYPPQPADADPLQRGIGAHRDFGVITLLLQGMSPGWRYFVIRCIDSCRAKPEDEKYAPISVDDYIRQKYKDVYGRVGIYSVAERVKE
ncbi:hypothetical protein KXX40_008893 [Aspergillus fumigatus]|nr:hypothetical protein KXX40_008893 [Aspergillus fumigatus]KAH1809798.1 hypothetical protein KXX27_007225 [Aspergillus fumigatus]KAH2133483.1 hypothetical protein KXW66_005425 [Aspergillus fumigatus]KAH2267291.1 hypothetical protein KXW96_008773 [Aspergillus fumigatus]KAH2683776.1 hypothetical protein KXV96_006183 [Aspergillus fumigatus]